MTSQLVLIHRIDGNNIFDLHHYTHILAFSCILATWNLLLTDYPLLASVIFTLALNLNIALCLPLVPVFLVQAVGKIIVSSPSANIVKQVDYIVWKIIFLCLNCTLVCAVIWWDHITKTNKASEADKLSFDFEPAREILTNHFHMLVEQLYGIPNLMLPLILLILVSSLPALYYLSKEVSESRQLIRATVVCSGLAYIITETGINP